jgi:helicase
MINETLRLWIAQSESWHSFLDFKLPVENKANYTFLKRSEDFYITLFGKMMEIIEEEDLSKESKLELLAIAKGLEIYSLKETADEFRGINLAKNMLYVSSLYYLADYTASAYILSRLFSFDRYDNKIEVFVSSFLQRELVEGNPYVTYIARYLKEGNQNLLLELKEIFEQKLEIYLNNDPDLYITYKIATALLSHFIKNNIWKDLKENTDSISTNFSKFVEMGLTKKPPVWNLFPSQRKALKQGILVSNKGFSLQMPTSAGKTAICELLIYDHLQKNKGSKVLFLAPFRALASELKNGFSKRLSDLNITSKSIYGGNIPTEEEKEAIQNVDVLIATPEKFIAIESILPDVYDMFSLIICDEGHLIDDTNRGLSYELLLSKFKSDNLAENKRFIFLSAIIPNIEEINEWLGGDSETVIKSNYRPTQLDYAFLKSMPNGNFLLDINPLKSYPYNYQLYNFLTNNDFKYLNPNTGRKNTYSHTSKKSKSVATSLKSLVTGTVALFSPQKKGDSGVQGLAEEAIKQISTLNLPRPLDYANAERISKLSEHFNRIFGKDYILSKLVRYGVVCHHGDLPQDIREIIEDAIRNSDVRLVICTNTLAEGVNLPIKVIVIHSTKRYNPKRQRWQTIKYRDLKNLVGRAGRAGKETKGLVIVIDSSDQQVMERVIQNEESEIARGYLYRVIKVITRFIEDNRLVIDNDFLEQQSEPFLNLLDSIDISLINLLTEEIGVEDLENQIKLLIQKTFAYYQASDREKATLQDLFLQRGKKLGTYVASNEFKIIKRSNSDIRLYENVSNILDLQSDIWITTDDPLSEQWINHILDILLQLPQVKYKIQEFNDMNSLVLEKQQIKKIISLWLNGKWYNEISLETGFEVDTLLNIFTSLINSQIQMYSSKVIRIASNLLEDIGKEISKVILDWPHYVNYGLKNRGELDLVEIGFVDRDAIIALYRWLKGNGMEYQTLKELRNIISQNRERIYSELKSHLTAISYERLLEGIKFCQHKNIL